MLENTFIHIQGIGPKTEKKLWEQGILTWRHFLNCKRIIFSKDRDVFICKELEMSFDHRNDIAFFKDRLSAAHVWRLYDDFKDKAVYLDIETSGRYQGMDEITVIGLYDGHEINTFIDGFNLNDFEIAIDRYDLVVTFNGGNFDLPFIERRFPCITLPPVHIDLRFFLRGLGYKGGLKSIEKQFGITRTPEIDGMNGYDAVLLWKAYQWGDTAALDRLIKYNTADIVNLKTIMESGYDQMKNRLLKNWSGQSAHLDKRNI